MKVHQAAVPLLIWHQWWPRGNLRHDHRMSENPWHTWWKIATGKRRDGISARPWHSYKVGPIWRRGGIPVVCRWWSQLCPTHQWERWSGGWMKHAQLLSLVARIDATWDFQAWCPWGQAQLVTSSCLCSKLNWCVTLNVLEFSSKNKIKKETEWGWIHWCSMHRNHLRMKNALCGAKTFP